MVKIVLACANTSFVSKVFKVSVEKRSLSDVSISLRSGTRSQYLYKAVEGPSNHPDKVNDTHYCLSRKFSNNWEDQGGSNSSK